MTGILRTLALCIVSCALTWPASTLAESPAASTCNSDRECKAGQQCINQRCAAAPNEPQTHSVDPTADELRAVGLDPNATSLDPRKSGTRTPAPAATAPSSSSGSSSPRKLSKTNLSTASSPTQSSAHSDSGSSAEESGPAPGEIGLGLQTFLIQDKVAAGIRLAILVDVIGIQTSFNLLYTTEEDPSGVLDGSFLAGTFGLHLLVKALDMAGFQARGGLGVDFVGVWGVKSDKFEVGVPVFAEVSYQAIDSLRVFLQPRYYLYTTDGLEVGTARNGDRYVPILLTAGIELTL